MNNYKKIVLPPEWHASRSSSPPIIVELENIELLLIAPFWNSIYPLLTSYRLNLQYTKKTTILSVLHCLVLVVFCLILLSIRVLIVFDNSAYQNLIDLMIGTPYIFPIDSLPLRVNSIFPLVSLCLSNFFIEVGQTA